MVNSYGNTYGADCDYNFSGQHKMNKLQKDLAVLNIAVGVALLTLFVMGILIVITLI